MLHWEEQTQNLDVKVNFIQIGAIIVNLEFKIYEATAAKTLLKIASSSFSIYFAIMLVCLTFES